MALKNIDMQVVVEESAYVVVTEKQVGVTDRGSDVATLIEQMDLGQGMFLYKGTLEKCLEVEHRVLLNDALDESAGTDSIAIPQRHTKYNLVDRVRSKDKPLIKLYSKIF